MSESTNVKKKGITTLMHQSLLWRSPSDEVSMYLPECSCFSVETDDFDIKYKPRTKGLFGGFSLYNRIQNSPCMPKAIRTSIYIGLGTSVVAFLLTSNVSRATIWAYATFSLSMYPMLIFYRYRLFKEEEERFRQMSAFQKHILYEGTEYEKELDRLLAKKSGSSASDKTKKRDWDLEFDKEV